MKRNKKILITGSSGFVGKVLIEKLKNLDLEIIRADIKKGIDLTDFDSVKKIPRFDLVVHLAAKTFVPDSFRNPRQFYYSNINSTLNILELCRKYDAKMIFASSYVYGNPEYLPIDEKHPLKAHNPYAQSKIICEKICEGYYRDHNVPVTILRPSNIYGKEQNKNFLIPKIIEQAKSGNIKLENSKSRRDFIYIDDIVRAYSMIVEKNIEGYQVYNLGAGKSYSVKDIVDSVRDLFDWKIPVSYEEKYRKNEIMEMVYDINKIKKEINWEPKYNLIEGLRQLL